jgi:hypothetical protein
MVSRENVTYRISDIEQELESTSPPHRSRGQGSPESKSLSFAQQPLPERLYEKHASPKHTSRCGRMRVPMKQCEGYDRMKHLRLTMLSRLFE